MHTVMNAIWKRIGERDKNWRFAYKALLCIDHILRNGSEQVIPECRRHSYDIQALMSFNLIDQFRERGNSRRRHSYDIQTLMSFHHSDENDKDQGVNGDYSADLSISFSATDAD